MNTLVNKSVNMLYFCKTEVQQNFIVSWLFLRKKFHVNIVGRIIKLFSSFLRSLAEK